jgi:hypothetical protein
MDTYVIGDIHGRYRQLMQLERDVPWDLEKDKIVFLGDLIDRGEAIPEAVDEVIRLKSINANVITIRGNHEQMLLDCLDLGDLVWLLPENGGQATIEQYGCPLSTLRDIWTCFAPCRSITRTTLQSTFTRALLLASPSTKRTRIFCSGAATFRSTFTIAGNSASLAIRRRVICPARGGATSTTSL